MEKCEVCGWADLKHRRGDVLALHTHEGETRALIIHDIEFWACRLCGQPYYTEETVRHMAKRSEVLHDGRPGRVVAYKTIEDVLIDGKPCDIAALLRGMKADEISRMQDTINDLMKSRDLSVSAGQLYWSLAQNMRVAQEMNRQ